MYHYVLKMKMRKYKIRNKINIPMINKGLSNPKKYVSV